jgi:hypothetical protein
MSIFIINMINIDSHIGPCYNAFQYIRMEKSVSPLQLEGIGCHLP